MAAAGRALGRLGAWATIGKTQRPPPKSAASGRQQLTYLPSSTIGAHDSGCLLGRPFFFEFEYKGMSDEAHLPAQQPRPKAPSRLPHAHGDGRRPQGSECSSRTRPQEAQRLVTIKKRADFVAANGGRRATTPGFILLVREREDSDQKMRVGFTVTKKIGGAVIRNRMKRRLRALAREIIPGTGFSGADHVLIGRAKGIERSFGLLRSELIGALEGLRAR